MLLDQGYFEENAPALTRSQASYRGLAAFVELLDAQAERSLSEDEKRHIFLKHDLWFPSKKHWMMDQLPYYRSLEEGGKLVPLTPSTR